VTATAKPPRTLAGALHSHCRCTGCRLGYAAWHRERRAALKAGTWRPWADAEPVRRHIEALHDSGMSYAVIGRLAKVRTGEIQRIRVGAKGRPAPDRIRHDMAGAILAVRLHFSRLPARAFVPTTGAARRIQALRAIGWTPTSGLGERTVYAILVSAHVEVGTHLRIAAVYEELHDQDPVLGGILPGIVERTRREAARRNWAVPAAWTDIDTDEHPDRRARGIRFARARPGDRGSDVIETTAELAASGATREEVAARIGISWQAVSAAHRRAETPIPITLRAPNVREAA
jgi:hypothetical protein